MFDRNFIQRIYPNPIFLTGFTVWMVLFMNVSAGCTQDILRPLSPEEKALLSKDELNALERARQLELSKDPKVRAEMKKMQQKEPNAYAYLQWAQNIILLTKQMPSAEDFDATEKDYLDGKYKECKLKYESLIKKLNKLNQRYNDPTIPEYLFKLENSLGNVFLTEHEYKEAENCYRQALKVKAHFHNQDIDQYIADLVSQSRNSRDGHSRQNAFDYQYINSGQTIHCLAISCDEQGKTDEAERLFKASSAVIGPSKQDPLVEGLKFSRQEIESIYQDLLNKAKKQFGDVSPYVATRLEALASFYKSQRRGDVEKTIELYKQATDIRKRYEPDPASHDDAQIIDNLERDIKYEKAARYSQSLQERGQILNKIMEQLPTAEDFDAAKKDYIEGKYKEARLKYENWIEKLNKLSQQYKDDNIPQCLFKIENLLGNVFLTEHKYQEAEKCYMQALTIRAHLQNQGIDQYVADLVFRCRNLRDHVLDSQWIDSGETTQCLAISCDEQGQTDEADRMFKASSVLIGPLKYDSLIEELKFSGEEIESIYQTLLKKAKTQFGDISPYTATRLEALASFYKLRHFYKPGHLKKAIELYNQAIDIRKRYEPDPASLDDAQIIRSLETTIKRSVGHFN